MVREGMLPQKGFIRQEEIPFAEYMRTGTGKLFA
jgi:hypothetical protein